jgi:hypothetical protein
LQFDREESQYHQGLKGWSTVAINFRKFYQKLLYYYDIQ